MKRPHIRRTSKLNRLRHLRVAVAENPSDVHFSGGGVDERKGDHLRAQAHDHHHAPRARRLRAQRQGLTTVAILCVTSSDTQEEGPNIESDHIPSNSRAPNCRNHLVSGSDSSRT